MSAADQQTWQALGTASAAGTADNYKARLTDDLVRLICRLRWGNGSVATGVAKRALAADFKGDMPAIYDRLKADDCPAGKAVSRHLMRGWQRPPTQRVATDPATELLAHLPIRRRFLILERKGTSPATPFRSQTQRKRWTSVVPRRRARRRGLGCSVGIRCRCFRLGLPRASSRVRKERWSWPVRSTR